MKQLRVLFFTLLFFHSKTGVAFNIHYCGNHIAKISWAFDAKKCGMEKKLSSFEGLHFSKSSCCLDELVIDQENTEHTQSEYIPLKFDNSTLFNICNKRIKSLNFTATVAFVCNSPPEKDFYKKNCSLLFYE